MTSSTNSRAVLAVGVVLACAFGGCGFDDTLTSRGFVVEGDQICIDTLVVAGVGLSKRTNVTGSEFLTTLGSAYGAAARRFRRLDIREEDEAMRDRVVAGYSSFARRFEAASRETATESARQEASDVFSDASTLQSEMKENGFRTCGGGGGPERRPR